MTTDTGSNHELGSTDVESTGDSHGGRAKPRYDDVNVPVVVMIGFISAVVTFLTIAFIQGLWGHWSATFVDNTPNPAIMETLNAQKSKLSANPETGRLSIDEAMNTMVEQFQQPGDVPPSSSETGHDENHESGNHGNANHDDGHSEDGGHDDGDSDDDGNDVENSDDEN